MRFPRLPAPGGLLRRIIAAACSGRWTEPPALIGGLSIFITLLNAASAREGDLALLRVMGASRPAVFGTILLEGILTRTRRSVDLHGLCAGRNLN